MNIESNTNKLNIVINGKVLTDGEVMTIRVAIDSYALTLKGGLGEDKLGKQITEGYKNNINSIRKKISGDLIMKVYVLYDIFDEDNDILGVFIKNVLLDLEKLAYEFALSSLKEALNISFICGLIFPKTKK